MNPNMAIQDMAFDPDPAEMQAGCLLPSNDSAVAVVEPEIEETPVTVNLPGMLSEKSEAPAEINQVVQVIGNLADTIGASAVLSDRFAVKRILISRWSGETNMERLAAVMGIRRPSLYRLLERGERKEHPAYEFFYAAFHQLHGATVLQSLEVVRRAAHSGNWKAAEYFLKIAAPDIGKDEPKAEVNVSGDMMIQVNGGEKSIRDVSTQDLLGAFSEGIGRLPEHALRELASRLPGNVMEIMRTQKEAVHG